MADIQGEQAHWKNAGPEVSPQRYFRSQEPMVPPKILPIFSNHLNGRQLFSQTINKEKEFTHKTRLIIDWLIFHYYSYFLPIDRLMLFRLKQTETPFQPTYPNKGLQALLIYAFGEWSQPSLSTISWVGCWLCLVDLRSSNPKIGLFSNLKASRISTTFLLDWYPKASHWFAPIPNLVHLIPAMAGRAPSHLNYL